MNREDWARVKEIVSGALEREPETRASWLAAQCQDEPEIRAEVDALLAADSDGSDFLDFDRPIQRAGPWRIVREVGSGGMGTVYLAERDDGQFEQRVALKIVKRGMDTDAVLRRFHAERRILARLNHPNITRLLDAGVVDARPYFVMDFIEGESISAFSRRTNLSVPRRIDLFLSVCDAVEHAHRNLILHRDIKSGNVLVDASGSPHLLDFGIARLIQGEDDTEQTAFHLRALTPQSASPEQIEGAPLTTASDVYSLGLLLFELLTGQPPYQIRNTSLAELTRVVCVEPVPRPSTVADAAHLRGDLDNIILKALEKDPACRYRTATELADDLRRHRSGQPVLARSGGALYRAGKFINRHSKSLAVAALVVIGIGAATAEAFYQQRRAERRFQDVRKLANSFLFEFHDAIAKLPGSTPARELVVTRALMYLDSLAKDAGDDETLRRELATSYMRVGDVQGSPYEPNLGKPADARQSYQRARVLFDEQLRRHPADAVAVTDSAFVQLRLAALLNSSGNLAPALELNRETIAQIDTFAARQKLPVKLQLYRGMAWFGIAESNMDTDAAAALTARLTALNFIKAAASSNPRDPDAQRWLSQTQKRLAVQYLQTLHDPAKAAESLSAAIATDEARLRANPLDNIAKLDLALGQSYLATVMRRRGDRAAAVGLLEKVISERSEALAADPRNVRARYLLLTDYTKFGSWSREDGNSAAAKQAFQKGMELIPVLTAGPVSQDTANAIEALRQAASSAIPAHRPTRPPG